MRRGVGLIDDLGRELDRGGVAAQAEHSSEVLVQNDKSDDELHCLLFAIRVQH